MGGMEADQLYQVRLTVSVYQEAKGHWFGVMSDVERMDR
jgi:hypothetical protein